VLGLCVLAVLGSTAACYLTYLALGLSFTPTSSGGWVMLLAPAVTPAILEPLIATPLIRSKDRVSSLLAQLEKAHRELESVAAQSVEAKGRFEELARRDPLTGLLNRRGFFESWEALERGAYRVMTVDIDQFKDINDTEGHAAGDRVLQAVAAALVAGWSDGAFVARLGGDEFAVVCAADHHVSYDEACDRLGDLAVSLDPDRSVTITCSVGVAELSRAASVDIALAQADRVMYAQKERFRLSAIPE
jgi:diguanylate cyclase (GGDEF)-like protein